MSQIFQQYITTPEGHSLSFFYNPENGLVVVDLCDKNERGGIELLRKTLTPSTMLAHCHKRVSSPIAIRLHTHKKGGK